MALDTYRKKRNFTITPEPAGRVRKRAASALAFVIQKHRASHMHYDFRLELDGVLLSWAVPKGPSLDPSVKRLAMHVEDHPVEYGDFEGVIPAGQYGGGTVLLWDRGVWVPEGDPREGYRKGKLKFRLEGEKLHGAWSLIRAWGGKNRDDAEKSWFLIKLDDEHARRGDPAITDEATRSVASGRELDEIAAEADRVWHSNKSVAENVRSGKARKPAPKKLDLSGVDGAREATMPPELSPQLATLIKAPPTGDDWVHEIKYDGYRMLCRVDGGEARMFSRNGKEWTKQFPTIVSALARLPAKQAWLDGEVVIMLEDGRTSFQALQNALGTGDASNMVCWLFDVVYLDGYDLREAPLVERKRLLERILAGQPAPLRYSPHIEGSGTDVYAQACKLQLEGIVSKRRASTYQSRRGADWLKVKCALRQEMVIGGYTDPGGSRTGFGALLLGVHDANGELRYCGKVGTGFNESLLQSLAAKLVQLEIKAPPFSNPPRGYDAKGAHWVKPALVAEVAFTEWTRDGTVRHPSFQGLRADKDPREVVHERAADDAAEKPAASGARPARAASGATKATEKKPATTRSSRSTGASKTASKTTASKTTASKTTASKTTASKTTAAGAVASKRAKKTLAKRTGTSDASSSESDASNVSAPAKPKAKRTRSALRVEAALTTQPMRMSPVRANRGESGDLIAGIALSNPDKVLYPEAGYTKRDLAEYYEAVGEWLLPHLRDRPLTLVRCPNGWTHCFYQKHAKDRIPDVIEKVEIREDDGSGVYMMANSVPAIVALLQMGVLELHPWGSRRQHLDRPDRLIFDFDPDEGLGWAPLVEAVELLHTLLDNLELASFVKTTGGKGLHVVAPVAPTLRWDSIKAFTKAIAELLVQASPQRFTAQLSKSHRGGKIFVDYLRNAEGATAVAAYSTRAKKNAPVSTPIAWSELDTELRFDHFNVRTVPGRLDPQHDPWAEMSIAAEQEITPAMLRRVGVRTSR